MESAIDWISALLRCGDHTGSRLFVLLFSAVASTITIMVAGQRLYRQLFGPSGPVRRVGEALRDEGDSRARRGESTRAMELYNLSILTNPRAGHVYYLRGLIQERRGNLNRAIADWRRCLDRIPNHGDALSKLAEHKRRPHNRTGWRLAFGAIALMVLLTSAGLFLSQKHWTVIAEFVTQAN